VVNPAGYQWSTKNDRDKPDFLRHRKNRREVTDDPRAAGDTAGGEIIGVDLNRNHPAASWGIVTKRMTVDATTIPAGRNGTVLTLFVKPAAKTEDWTMTLEDPGESQPKRWKLSGSVSGEQGTAAHQQGSATVLRATNQHIEFTITDGSGDGAFQVGDSIVVKVTRQPDETTSRKRWQNTYCGKPGKDATGADGNWTGVDEADPHPNGPSREKETEAIYALSQPNSPFKPGLVSCHIDVHSYLGTVGWVPNAPRGEKNLRPKGEFDDATLLKILGAQAASLIKDPVAPEAAALYKPQASPYPTSGDILEWQYLKQTQKKCLPFLIEVGKAEFAPPDPDKHADAVLPGMLFMMFSTVDKEFSSEPQLKFKKPAP
jgi:hypothetical protein